MHYSVHIQKQDLGEFGEFFLVKYSPEFRLRHDIIFNECCYTDIQEMISRVEGHIVLMHVRGHDVSCQIAKEGLLNDEISKISKGLLRSCEEPVL